jgi:GNAT superfamily N-acetyltransferase
MIRPAEIADKVRVITLLRNSRNAAGFDDAGGPTGFTFDFDPAYAERLFLAHLEPHRLCLVLIEACEPQGVLMAACGEHPFGPVRLARETVWWIEPQYRGLQAMRMLNAYEAWATSEGCQFSGMAGMGDDPDVGKLYLRRGYQVAEQHYLKAL